MRISSTVHYASRLLVKLALHVPANGPLSASELADSTGISVKFIEKIIRQLRSAGMVRSIRGAAGGHLLSIKPEDVTLGDVLRVVEGGVQPPCNGEADSPDAPCRCRIAWTAAAKALEDTLDRFTIADIMVHPKTAQEQTTAKDAHHPAAYTHNYAHEPSCAYQSQ